MKRAIIIVLDGVGIGASPDSYKYNDENANTIVHVAEYVNGLKMPNMQQLGLGNITQIKGVQKVDNPHGSFGKMQEKSLDKDSTSGHWEIAGLVVNIKFPTYPNGFPDDIINKFIKLTGVPGVLCNKPYSGTEAIKDFGEEHIRTKKPIVYTSADSVFQIAAHEEVYPLKELYKMCEIARFKIFNGETNIGRVIARPFLGKTANDFYRTGNRKDYSVDPVGPTLLTKLKDAGYEVAGVGKIEDLFNFKGLTKSYHSKTNPEGIEYIKKYLKEVKNGLIFANLVDFDTLWGHRNNPVDFAKGLEYFDEKLPDILSLMEDEDILFITADHGCDPTVPGTDHTREYVPLIVFGKKYKSVDLGIRETFSDIAATIFEYFNVEGTGNGNSFLKEISQ
jgi:phosphopentomutase